MPRRSVLLVQLPIPPAGAQPVEANIPLAAGYLKLLAQRRGLAQHADVELLPPAAASVLGDRALAAEIVARHPSVVGFTCYLWNIERTLWLANELKRRDPRLIVVLGGPEMTIDNRWVFAAGGFDYAVIGEGEETFCELIEALAGGGHPQGPVAGLAAGPRFAPPKARTPLPSLDEISSPYLAGILDAEGTILLETARGCRFRCKFCYYAKSLSQQRFLSEAHVRAQLEHARQRGTSEVFLLDPTLNQRPDFAALVQWLAEENRDHGFTYSAELRAEGIDTAVAAQLREANFAEVEIGLQSVDPSTQELIGRPVHLPSFVAGTRALIDAGIRTRVDLIVGLPGDTADSVRRGIDLLVSRRLASEAQVFNLSLLPGTALRQEAGMLGLHYQDRPPYYVLETPALDLGVMAGLMIEAQEAFGIAFDPAPLPELANETRSPEYVRLPGLASDATVWRRQHVDLDDLDRGELMASLLRALAMPALGAALWLHSSDFDALRHIAAELVAGVLEENPFTTLDVVFESTSAQGVSIRTLAAVHATCFRRPTYLDRCGSVQPAGALAARRLIVTLPAAARSAAPRQWLNEAADYAVIAWRGQTTEQDLGEHEYVVP